MKEIVSGFLLQRRQFRLTSIGICASLHLASLSRKLSQKIMWKPILFLHYWINSIRIVQFHPILDTFPSPTHSLPVPYLSTHDESEQGHSNKHSIPHLSEVRRSPLIEIDRRCQLFIPR